MPHLAGSIICHCWTLLHVGLCEQLPGAGPLPPPLACRLLLEGADIEAAVSAPRMHNSFSGSGTSIENFVFG